MEQEPVADAIIVGSGLAGQTAALHILDRGGKVILVEKEPILGGNSNKASSGINGCCNGNGNITAAYDPATNDTVQLFFQDTFRSAGTVADVALIETLVRHSAAAVDWLERRAGVDFSAPLVQLGGHSRKRTHRPSTGFVGAEVMNALQTAIRSYEAKGYAKIMVDHKVTSLLNDSLDQIRGAEVKTTGLPKQKYSIELLRSDHVILATGGFASDRSEGSLLRQYRPDLQNMAATAGAFSTGDGIGLVSHLGAELRDMEKIQIHPTGFVDPADPTNGSKVLAAELLRGVGGILINQNGRRFCNELGTRSYVTVNMLEHDPEYADHRTWNPETPVPTFYLILSSAAAQKAQKHLDSYRRKGLITNIHGISDLAEHLEIPEETLTATMQEYQELAASGAADVFGKTVFECVPRNPLQDEDFFVGEVTPVLHYVMGGLKINPSGEVLRSDGSTIAGLRAIGEVTGGVHGDNRLGGNSLLECAVFGSIVGSRIPVKERHDVVLKHQMIPKVLTPRTEFTIDDLSRHNIGSDCFVGLEGKVYDLTSFLDHHPGGKHSILSLCGTEATEIFLSVHSARILNVVEKHIVGLLSEPVKTTSQVAAKLEPRIISRDELSRHNSADDCWVVIHGQVFDLTEFSKSHPGGAYMVQKMAGKDATKSYQVFHSQDKLKMVHPYLMGTIMTDQS